MQMTFDEAAPKFEAASVELLHIDGLHTYEAVRHDFETWREKMGPRGVVLFHDTAVHQGDFGVHKFWAEIREKYRGFEFTHGNGLGVLAVGAESGTAMGELLEAGETDLPGVRKYFAHLGSFVTHLRVLRLMASGSFNARQLVDLWMQHGGVKRPGKTPDWTTQLMVDNPVPFWQQFLTELQEMANFDLELRKRMSGAGPGQPGR